MKVILLPLNVRKHWKYAHGSQTARDLRDWHKLYPQGQPQMRNKK